MDHFIFRAWWPLSDIDKYSQRVCRPWHHSLPILQCGSCHAKQRASATPAAGRALIQRRGGRRRTSGTTASATLEFVSFLLPHFLLQCWRVPEGPLLKMSHTDGGETLRIFLEIRPPSSSPENKIVHNTGRERLNQFINFNHYCFNLILL